MIVGCFSATRRGKPARGYITHHNQRCFIGPEDRDQSRSTVTRCQPDSSSSEPSSVTNPLHDVQDPCPGSPRTAVSPKRNDESLDTTFVVSPRAAPYGNPVSREYHSPVTSFGGGERDRTDDLMLAKHVLSQLSYAPGRLVGQGGLEPPTSRLSSARSNQLSY